jgi:hypothetical protein
MTAWHLIAVMIFVGIGAAAGMIAAFIALMGELDLEMHLGRSKDDGREQRELANR